MVTKEEPTKQELYRYLVDENSFITKYSRAICQNSPYIKFVDGSDLENDICFSKNPPINFQKLLCVNVSSMVELTRSRKKMQSHLYLSSSLKKCYEYEKVMACNGKMPFFLLFVLRLSESDYSVLAINKVTDGYYKIHYFNPNSDNSTSCDVIAIGIAETFIREENPYAYIEKNIIIKNLVNNVLAVCGYILHWSVFASKGCDFSEKAILTYMVKIFDDQKKSLADCENFVKKQMSDKKSDDLMIVDTNHAECHVADKLSDIKQLTHQNISEEKNIPQIICPLKRSASSLGEELSSMNDKRIKIDSFATDSSINMRNLTGGNSSKLENIKLRLELIISLIENLLMACKVVLSIKDKIQNDTYQKIQMKLDRLIEHIDEFAITPPLDREKLNLVRFILPANKNKAMKDIHDLLVNVLAEVAALRKLDSLQNLLYGSYESLIPTFISIVSELSRVKQIFSVIKPSSEVNTPASFWSSKARVQEPSTVIVASSSSKLEEEVPVRVEPLKESAAVKSVVEENIKADKTEEKINQNEEPLNRIIDNAKKEVSSTILNESKNEIVMTKLDSDSDAPDSEIEINRQNLGEIEVPEGMTFSEDDFSNLPFFDNHWYDDKEIQALLRILLGNKENIEILASQFPFLTSDSSQLCIEAMMPAIKSAVEKNKITLMPMNTQGNDLKINDYALAENAGSHWVGVCIRYDADQKIVIIKYIDPLGSVYTLESQKVDRRRIFLPVQTSKPYVKDMKKKNKDYTTKLSGNAGKFFEFIRDKLIKNSAFKLDPKIKIQLFITGIMQQKNSYDCGPLVVYDLMSAALGTDLEENPPVQKLRKIYEKLLENDSAGSSLGMK